MMMDFSNDLDKVDEWAMKGDTVVLNENGAKRMCAIFEFENMAKRFGWLNPFNWDKDRMLLVPINNECGLRAWKLVRNPAWKKLDGEDERKELWMIMQEGFVTGYEKNI